MGDGCTHLYYYVHTAGRGGDPERQGGGGGAQTSSFTLCVDFDIRRVKNAAVLATVGSQDFSLQYTDRLDRFYVMVVLCFKLSV